MSTEPNATTVIELLVLSPAGLEGDAPAIASYTKRFTALALAASSLIDTN